ncbi:MAG: DNA ligase-associated DEXH box helicase, partial [Planctomycetales bacterium]|nr:DNA ligase-associated DEXH box helicase [Planctomycetales bacterium]
PISPRLASAVRQQLHAASLGRLESAELRALDSLLDLQTQWSVIPKFDEMLMERYQSRGRYQWCVYPLEGHLVHEGLSALIAHRISLALPMTVMMTVNEYGFMLESTQPLPASESDWRQWLRPAESEGDLLEALNSTEMAKRQFREIARIAGLIHPGYPGKPKRARHLQASSNMFFDTFQTYDHHNRLVHQARQEVLQRQLDWSRMIDCLASIQDKRLTMVTPPAWSPLAFPLFVDRLRDRVSSETLDARIAKELERLNRMAGVE